LKIKKKVYFGKYRLKENIENLEKIKIIYFTLKIILKYIESPVLTFNDPTVLMYYHLSIINIFILFNY